MISATRRWFRRNRTPLAIGVGVIGAGYLATQYVLSKINDARERMSSDRIAKENLRRRFEQNQEDCTFTVLALLPTATTNILNAMNTEAITLEIQQMKGNAKSLRSSGESSATPPSIADTTMTEEEGKSIGSLQSESGVHASQMTLPSISNAGDGASESGRAVQRSRKTKRQLWDDLTISSTGTAQSTINLENNDDDNPEQAYGSDFDTNRKYLTYSWWLLNRGWVEIMENVEAAVREVFGHLSPRDLLSFDTFSQLTIEVRKKMEGRTEEEEATKRPGAKWLPYLLPPTKMEDFVLREAGVLGESTLSTSTQSDTPASPSSETPLRRLLDETSDLIESPAFSHVLTLLLDAGFRTLLHKKVLPGAFDLPATTFITPVGSEVVQLVGHQAAATAAGGKVVLLPKILSVLTRQAHAIGNGMPNEYLQEMEQVRDLEAFAAVVYSSNWENEIHQEEGIAASRGPGDETASAVGGPETSTAGRLSQVSTLGEESLVLVDPSQSQAQSLFENAWERAG
ncbi:hypothetical protein Hte_002733 [Hypoxylon texense]